MSTSYSPKIVTDGLITYMDAANAKSYIGSGSTWSNLASSSYDGTNYNIEYSSDGQGCFVYNAANDRTYISENFMGLPTSMSMSAWFKMTGGAGTYRCIVHKGSGASVGSSQYWTGFSAANNIIATIGATNGVGWAAGDTGIGGELDTWYNTVVTWDGSVCRVYLDGGYIKQYNLVSLTDMNYPTRYGACSDTGGYQVIGKIAVVSIYRNRVLSDSEIERNYDALKGRFGY